MATWDKLVWEPRPVRDTNTYKRMIALAIAERDIHDNISPHFKLCIPLDYLRELSLHFPQYVYTVLGVCFHDEKQVYVTWQPFAQRKNH